jgi:hypothetical protein
MQGLQSGHEGTEGPHLPQAAQVAVSAVQARADAKTEIAGLRGRIGPANLHPNEKQRNLEGTIV